MKRIISLILILGVVSMFRMTAFAADDALSKAGLHLKSGTEDGVLLSFRTSTNENDFNPGFVVHSVGGTEYPAYCINPNKPGVKLSGAYDVDINEMINDPKVYGAITNGYPFKTPAELGVSTPYQAYYATAIAVWTLVHDTYSDVNDWAAYGEQNEPVYTAMKNIRAKGAATTSIPSSAGTITATAAPAYTMPDAIDSNYLSQTFTVTADSGYKVEISGSAPSGTKISDETNVIKSTFSKGEKFKILVPKLGKFQSGNFNLKLTPTNTADSMIVLYGKSANESNQDYAVVTSGVPTGGSATATYRETVGDPDPDPDPEPDPDPPCILILQKVEQGTTKGLAGAIFRVTDADGGVVGDYVTGSNGKVTVMLDSAGCYYVDEITPPAGYLLDDNSHKDVVVSAEEENILIFANRPTSSVKITKVDADTGERLSGAVVRVAYDGGHEFIDVELPTGTATVSGLRDGTYTVTEIVSPAGYILDSTPHSIKLEGGRTSEIVLKNSHTPGILIKKFDEKTGLPLAEAEFSIEQKAGKIVYQGITGKDGTIFVENLDPDWYRIREIAAPEGYLMSTESQYVELVAGKVLEVKFDNRKRPSLEILKIDEATGQPLAGAVFKVWKTEGGTVSEYTTGTNGIITINNLDEAVYSVKEVIAPDGYILGDCHKDILLEWGTTKNLIFTNKRRPTLEIIKLDEETKAPLQGAKFKVWATEGDTVGEYLTDKDGRILIADLDAKIYSVEEIIAPEGYVLNSQKKEILLEWGKVNTLVFTNLKKPTLTLIKYDELTNKPLAGASFKLWKTEGETWSETMVTDENGRITWTDLDPAIYSLQEIDEPYGYFKDNSRKEILLEAGDNKELEFFNRPRPVLTILKRDKVTGEPLEGVKFRVQRIEGETIGEFLTDKNGKIELSPATGYLLEEKIYRVTEITPPDKYLLSENSQKHVLLKWYEPTELVFENLLKPTLIFIKRDGMSGRGISGATYKVEYESANGGVKNLGSYVTKCGLIVLPHVDAGWYSLTETKAASGYSLPTNPTQRLYLASGENSYNYDQTNVDLYVDQRTNPSSGSRGKCEDWCGYMCSVLCAGNCGNAGDGSMSGGTGGSFGNITITNGNGDKLGSTSGGSTEVDTTKPTLIGGAVTRKSDLSATVQFTSSEAGKYYYSVVNSGVNEPAIGTGGLGSACVKGTNTATIYMTAGAKDVYIKVKDASGNVSNALKITVPAFSSEPKSDEENDVPNFDDIKISGGTIVYLNPDFSDIKITFGN